MAMWGGGGVECIAAVGVVRVMGGDGGGEGVGGWLLIKRGAGEMGRVA